MIFETLPARPEIVAVQDVAPGVKLFEVVCDDLYDVREQDVLVDEVDGTKTYRVRGVSHFQTPHLAHTECTAQATWGTD